jgi:hypothetical protein
MIRSNLEMFEKTNYSLDFFFTNHIIFICFKNTGNLKLKFSILYYPKSIKIKDKKSISFEEGFKMRPKKLQIDPVFL